MGMMSYPNFGGKDKAIHHPDLVVLARLCEEAGVDLRVLVLQRDAAAILRSTTIHRDFGTEAHQAAILTDNAAALVMQLKLLDRKFFRCAEFEDFLSSGLEKSNFFDDLVPFLHPSLSASTFKAAQSNVSEHAAAASTSAPGVVHDEEKTTEKMSSHEKHLAEAVAFLRTIC